MDPTTQSPLRMTVPVPFSDGIDIPVPSGPHFYSNKTWIGRMSDGITPRQAFESLSRHATLGQDRASVNGGAMDIPIWGPVRQIVDPDRLMIINTTQPGHELYPGNVHRSIVQEGDDLYVMTHGYGMGKFPLANKIVAPLLWKSVDSNIRHDLNPEIRPAGAATTLVRDSVARSGTPDRYNVFEYGFPPSDAMLPSAASRTAIDAGGPGDGPLSPVQTVDSYEGSSNSPPQPARPVRYLGSTRVRC